MCEVSVEVGTAELLETKPFCADWGLIDTGECFEQFSSPLIDMLEGECAFQGMYHGLDKKYALFWIGQMFIEHLYISDVSLQLIVELENLIQILLQNLYFF